MNLVSNIKGNRNEIQNVRFQNLSTPPSAPVAGLFYYDTTLNKLGVYNGVSWNYYADINELSLKADSATVYTITQINNFLGAKVDKTTTINGYGLTSNIVLSKNDIALNNVTNDAQVKRSELGVSNGVATLDAGGKLTTAQIPSSLVGSLSFQGTWNASTNTPTIVSGSGTKGYYYKVSVAGNTIIDGNGNWTSGDLVVFGDTAWDKVEGGSPDVVSVAGRVGVITLSTDDVTPTSTKGYVTSSQITTINNTTGINTGDETTATIKTKLGVTTLSGSNTGDQTITLTGDVVGSGTGSFVTNLSNASVSLAKMANLAANTFIGNNTASAATPIAMTVAQTKALLGYNFTDIAGTNTVAKGGTGVGTITGYIKGNGTSAFTASSTIPGSDISGNIPGNAANVTGIVSVVNGGTGVATLTGHIKGNGVNGFTASSTIPGSDISGNITGNAANVTGTVPVTNGGTGATDAVNARTNIGAVGKYSVQIGNNSANTFTISHGLNSINTVISVWETSNGNLVCPDINRVDANNISVSFTVIPTLNQYEITIIG